MLVPTPRPLARSTPAAAPSLEERSASKGIALLSVVTVLVALIVIAIPFAISMKLGRDRTESQAFRERAAFESSLIVDAVQSYLRGTHPFFEQERAKRGEVGVEADDRVDSINEMLPPASYREKIAELWPVNGVGAGGASGATRARLNDPRGSIWNWLVMDENGKVNPNAASPYLLGNLLGGAILGEELDASATDIPVSNVTCVNAPGASPFRKSGGFIRIGRETIKYASFDSGSGFKGCERGALQGSPLVDNGPSAVHPKGDVVIDYTAYKLATHLISSHVGSQEQFRTLEDLKSIANWGPGGVLETERFESIAPFLTVWSRRETAETFLNGQLIVAFEGAGKADGGQVLRMRDKTNLIGNTAYLNPGTIVQIADGTGQVDYGIVAFSGDPKGGDFGNIVTLAGGVVDTHTYEGGKAVASPLAPYPICVNTAPREVIAACLANLHLRGATEAEKFVTPTLAWQLAGMIVDERSKALTLTGDDHARQTGPFRSARDVGRWLENLQIKGTISFEQRSALMRNVINPHDDGLAFGTAPFCYRTLDVYTVEGRAIVNNAAGEKVAESAMRRVVEIGADQLTVWSLSSQSDFEIGLAQGSGGKYATTYPFNCSYVSDRDASVQPRRRAPQQLGFGIYPDDDRELERDRVGLEAARIKLPGDVFHDHFDTAYDAEGWNTRLSGPYSKAVSGLLKKKGNDPYIHPFTISFWWRPRSSGNWYAFDTGKDAYENRIALFVRDGGKGGQELTFRVCDTTLQKQGAEISVPLTRLDYQSDNWYHLQATARGCDPTQMELLVDGLSVGTRHEYAYLSDSIQKDSTGDISVDTTDGFPVNGAVLIGSEVIEYDDRSSNSFAAGKTGKVLRGARGTAAGEWPKGAGVRPVGYSHPLTLDLRKGGSSLSSGEWWTWDLLQVQVEGTEDKATASNGVGSITFYGIKEETKSAKISVHGIYPSDIGKDQDVATTFQEKGYAILLGVELDMGDGGVTPMMGPPGMAGGRAAPGRAAPPSPGGSFPGGAPGGGAGGGAGGGSGGNPVPPAGGGGSIPGGGGLTGPRAGTITLNGATKIGGWEVVYYKRSSSDPTKLDIDRAQTTPLHRDRGTPFFISTHSDDPKFVTYLAPISVLGTSGAGAGKDYFDGALTEDKKILDKYPDDGIDTLDSQEGAGWPRVLVGTDYSGQEDQSEVFVYNSLDRAKASPSLLFLRDLDADLVALEKAVIPNTVVAVFPVPKNPGPLPPSAPAAALPPSQRFASSFANADAPVEIAADGEPIPGGSGTSEPPPPPDPPPPPTPGGSIPPGAGHEPPPDTGGGGAEPEPTPGGGGSIPPSLRAPSDEDPNASSSPISSSGPIFTLQVLSGVFKFRGIHSTSFSTTERTGRQHGTSDKEENRRLLPCFRYLRRDATTGNHTGGYPAGRNDVITVTTGGTNPDRDQYTVRWGDAGSNWAALTDWIKPSTPYATSDEAGTSRTDYRGLARILRFPSGELPDENSENIEWGKSTIAGSETVQAFLDELYVWQHELLIPLGRVANTENLDEKTEEVGLYPVPPATTLVGIQGCDKDCGLVDIDGEIIAYRGTRTEGTNTLVLERLVRGVLGTKPRPHAKQAYARFVPNMPVSYLQGAMTRESASIPMGRTKDWPREGLVRIVGQDSEELVHFTGRSDAELSLPSALDADPAIRGRGLLRGRFGSDITPHDDGELVVWQPFRFWDRYMPRRTEDKRAFSGVHDHPDASYIEIAKTVYGAFWQRVYWAQNIEDRVSEGKAKDRGSHAASKLKMLVLARFNPNIPWDSKDVVDLRSDHGGSAAGTQHPASKLYIMDDPEAANEFGFEADTAEFRVFFEYLPGSYVPQDLQNGTPSEDLVFENAWKKTPYLRRFTAEYFSRTRTRYNAAVR